jgi:peptidyl-prolyl cis-trans isomerase B (cyclophilin B)
MQPVIGFLALFSVLVPQKVWFAPSQPVTVSIKSDAPVTLTLTDFSGQSLATAKGDPGSVDLKQLFPAIGQVGTYIVYAGTPTDFAGTPLLIEDRSGKDSGPGPTVLKVEPLRYAEMTTDMGKLTCVFYFDVAPNTADNFLDLASGGYYDGLTFHRIMPGFVIQGGDPRGDGTGGPGYTIGDEFSDQQHLEGVLSMAHTSEPNSAGSQFFVCLNYAQTQQLDGKYAAFGKVTDGMDAVRKIAATPLAANQADPESGTPVKAPVIQKVEVLPVTKDHNPYAAK